MTPERIAALCAIGSGMTAYETPEEAARLGLQGTEVRVVGVAVRGDRAVVAQIVNADGYPDAYEIETANCYRGPNGWEEGSSGNGNGGRILTSEDRMTFVWWGEAPRGATAARVGLGEQEQTVLVKDGFIFAVFDDVPFEEPQGTPLPHGHAFVRRGKLTAKERRAFFGFDQPEVREWLYVDDEPPS
jgi:hypothetical protein